MKLACLAATFLTRRHNVTRNFCHFLPFDVEAAGITKQRSPDTAVDVHDDAEALRSVVVPLSDVGDPAEQHGEAETDHTLVESLRPRTKSQAALLVDGQIDIHGEVFVRTEIIDDSLARFAVDHVRVEA